LNVIVENCIFKETTTVQFLCKIDQAQSTMKLGIFPRGCAMGWKQSAYVAWPNDGACPIPHVHVVTVFHAIAYCAIAYALLALLKLFQEPKVPWHCDDAQHLY
jgi:hypothetical protein